jgi:hypothetical protein
MPNATLLHERLAKRLLLQTRIARTMKKARLLHPDEKNFVFRMGCLCYNARAGRIRAKRFSPSPQPMLKEQ